MTSPELPNLRGIILTETSQGRACDLPPDEWIWDELVQFGVVEVENVQAANLTGEIHPIFKYNQWDGMPRERYRALKQSFILASNILRAAIPEYFSSWLPFPNYHTDGEPVVTTERPNSKLPRSPPKPSGVVAQIQNPSTQRVQAALDLFEIITRETQWREDTEMLQKHTWWGITSPIHPSEPPFRPPHEDELVASDELLRADGLERRQITVGIASAYVDALLASEEDSEQHVRAAFHAAITLVHEIAHVVFWQNINCMPEQGDEPRVGNICKLSEIGCAFIGTLFAGWEPAPINMGDRERFAGFQEGSMWMKQYTLPQQPLDYLVHYSISFNHIQRIMSQESWDELGPHPTLVTMTTMLFQPPEFRNGTTARISVCTRIRGMTEAGDARWIDNNQDLLFSNPKEVDSSLEMNDNGINIYNVRRPHDFQNYDDQERCAPFTISSDFECSIKKYWDEDWFEEGCESGEDKNEDNKENEKGRQNSIAAVDSEFLVTFELHGKLTREFVQNPQMPPSIRTMPTQKAQNTTGTASAKTEQKRGRRIAWTPGTQFTETWPVDYRGQQTAIYHMCKQYGIFNIPRHRAGRLAALLKYDQDQAERNGEFYVDIDELEYENGEIDEPESSHIPTYSARVNLESETLDEFLMSEVSQIFGLDLNTTILDLYCGRRNREAQSGRLKHVPLIPGSKFSRYGKEMWRRVICFYTDKTPNEKAGTIGQLEISRNGHDQQLDNQRTKWKGPKETSLHKGDKSNGNRKLTVERIGEGNGNKNQTCNPGRESGQTNDDPKDPEKYSLKERRTVGNKKTRSNIQLVEKAASAKEATNAGQKGVMDKNNPNQTKDLECGVQLEIPGTDTSQIQEPEVLNILPGSLKTGIDAVNSHLRIPTNKNHHVKLGHSASAGLIVDLKRKLSTDSRVKSTQGSATGSQIFDGKKGIHFDGSIQFDSHPVLGGNFVPGVIIESPDHPVPNDQKEYEISGPFPGGNIKASTAPSLQPGIKGNEPDKSSGRIGEPKWLLGRNKSILPIDHEPNPPGKELQIQNVAGNSHQGIDTFQQDPWSLNQALLMHQQMQEEALSIKFWEPQKTGGQMSEDMQERKEKWHIENPDQTPPHDAQGRQRLFGNHQDEEVDDNLRVKGQRPPNSGNGQNPSQNKPAALSKGIDSHEIKNDPYISNASPANCGGIGAGGSNIHVEEIRNATSPSRTRQRHTTKTVENTQDTGIKLAQPLDPQRISSSPLVISLRKRSAKSSTPATSPTKLPSRFRKDIEKTNNPAPYGMIARKSPTVGPAVESEVDQDDGDELKQVRRSPVKRRTAAATSTVSSSKIMEGSGNHGEHGVESPVKIPWKRKVEAAEVPAVLEADQPRKRGRR